jgi:hypothetical protein
MIKQAAALMLAVPLLFSALPAFAHNEIEVGDIRIVGGWGIEPPLMGQLNTIVLEVTHVSDGTPVTNAFSSADVSVKKGGVEKPLDLRPTEEPGVYEADIIPTQRGLVAVIISGSIAGQAIRSQIEIEDVEDPRKLQFPEAGDDQGVPQGFVDEMRRVISDLTVQAEDAKSAAQDASEAASGAAETAGEVKAAADMAYLVGIVGIGVGIAGIAIGAVALSRRV